MMSCGVWKCENCGYSVGASWGQVSLTCPRCNGKSDFVEKLIKKNDKLQAEVKLLKEKIAVLEERISPSHLGQGI